MSHRDVVVVGFKTTALFTPQTLAGVAWIERQTVLVQSHNFRIPSRRHTCTSSRYRYTGRFTIHSPADQQIGRVSYLIYVSMRHYVFTTSGDIVVCFHTTVCLSC